MRALSSCASAARAVSTASSPTFFAGFSGPPSRRRLVCDSSGGACRRSLIVAARRRSTSFLSMLWLIQRPAAKGNRRFGALRGLVEPDGEPGRRHMVLGLTDRMLAIVKDGGGEHRRSMTVPHALDQMVKRPDTPAGDHRHRNGIGDGAGERKVEAGAGSVPVH